MNNTNNALETLVQRDKQIKKANDKLKASINELDAELSTHASNTDIHTSKEELIKFIVDHLESLDLGITKEVVSVLPTENISDNTLYFVPNDKGSRDEYFYINDKWELVGSTETNFTDYYTKQETNTLLEGKANSKHNHVVKDITDFPTIPTKVSDLTNDSGYITSVSWEDVTSKPELSQVAISGSYSDLSDTPTIPTRTSQLINDSGFLTSSSGLITSVSWSDITDKPNFSTVATSGSYNDLSNKPTIPTKVSQLENDMGFGTGGDTSDCVHKTGDETINGIKTFNDTVIQKKDGIFKNDNVDITTTPSSNLFAHLFFADKNSVANAYVRYVQRTNGINELNLFVRDKDLNHYGVTVNTNNEFLPVLNNTYSLGSIGLKWANVYSTNDITNKVITYSVTNHNNTSTMTVSGGSSWDTGSTLFLYGNSHSNYPGAFDLTAKNTTNESKLIGFPDGSLTWGGKNVALDENLVHRSGNETIKGVKFFDSLVYLHSNMSNKNSQMDLFTTPANNLYAHYMFIDKNNEITAYMQYGQQNTGTDFIGLFIHDKNRALHGIQVTTNNYVVPLTNNVYSLGASNNKWANVFATTFNGNLNGNANSATYATTQATTDNSTRIATTAWVRNYVNSVVGSGSIGASISAYYSNATTVTAEGNSSSSGGYYPSDYSDYINISPTVGTIYTGSQLFGTLNSSASGSKYLSGSSSGLIYQTTAKATATFSGAFSSSSKYLCTTANAVRFRAFVSQGTNSNIGTASVVDNSSAKSIFIRVQ